MKQAILTAVKLTIACVVLFCGLYTGIVWLMAQAAPAKAEGEKAYLNGKVVGYAREGQSFTGDRYFQGRPSACNYNAAASSGSNKGPSNPSYLAEVSVRVDSFLAHNPSVPKSDLPAELVTASGSGLDPDISPAAAYVQVARVAASRHLSQQQLKDLVAKHVETPLLGILGMPRVNVLALNIDLDQLSSQK